jgi:hypothetical protein
MHTLALDGFAVIIGGHCPDAVNLAEIKIRLRKRAKSKDIRLPSRGKIDVMTSNVSVK